MSALIHNSDRALYRTQRLKWGHLSVDPARGSVGEAINTSKAARSSGRTRSASARRAAAEQAGYAVRVEEAPTTGLNAEALPRLLERWEAYRHDAPPGDRPLCLVSGGETLVEVTGQGLGGRCQELAALMMPRLDERSVFLAAGSDGNDGPTDAAGGVVDRESWLRVQAEDIPYAALLADHDSYRLLERSRNLIKVPPTRNNVMDVHLFLGER
ncbi:MAG: hypothetical protein IIA41_13220 [SAR324 cluster bacterium]|nr:hypothetical protein [SAR324 cluster bacterium]